MRASARVIFAPLPGSFRLRTFVKACQRGYSCLASLVALRS